MRLIRKCAAMHAAITVLRRRDVWDIWVDPVDPNCVLYKGDRVIKPTMREAQLAACVSQILNAENPAEMLLGFNSMDILEAVGAAHMLLPLMTEEYVDARST